MATETTTASAVSTVAPRGDVGFRPIDWWADLDDGATEQADSQRRTPPIPAFVRLSRLIVPATISPAQGTEPDEAVDPPVLSVSSEPSQTDREPAPNGPWPDSVGRPLFRIGLAAILTAIVVGVTTFGSSNDRVTTVDTPEPTTVVGPGRDGLSGDGVAGTDEQARGVLEALVRQTSSGPEADLSIVGSASASRNEIRWTATVRNTGPATAEGPIMVVHTIGSTFELVSVAGSGWDCRHLRTAGTISCELDEDLGTGQRRRLGLVTSIAGVEPGTSIPSTMSVVAGTADPSLDDNTVNVTAVSAPTDDADRSPSAGEAGQSGTDTDADTTPGSTGSGSDGHAGSTGMQELPRTGSGFTAALGVAGLGLCLTGRRLMTWSARAQTRTLLKTIHIG